MNAITTPFPAQNGMAEQEGSIAVILQSVVHSPHYFSTQYIAAFGDVTH